MQDNTPVPLQGSSETVVVINTVGEETTGKDLDHKEDDSGHQDESKETTYVTLNDDSSLFSDDTSSSLVSDCDMCHEESTNHQHDEHTELQQAHIQVIELQPGHVLLENKYEQNLDERFINNDTGLPYSYKNQIHQTSFIQQGNFIKFSMIYFHHSVKLSLRRHIL